MFDELIVWAEGLTSLPNVRLFTYSGLERTTLLPRIMPDNAGLVTIWNDKQQPYISVWRTVFERCAPNTLESVERAVEPDRIGQGTVLKSITSEILEELTRAYKEANGD